MTTFRIHGLLPALLLVAGVSPLLAAHTTTVEDIVRMHEAGLSEATILNFLESYEVCIPLTAQDLVSMADAGLSQALIDAMVDIVSRCPPANAATAGYGALARRPYSPPTFRRSYYDPYYGSWPYPSYFYVSYHSLGHHHLRLANLFHHDHHRLSAAPLPFAHGHHGVGLHDLLPGPLGHAGHPLGFATAHAGGHHGSGFSGHGGHGAGHASGHGGGGHSGGGHSGGGHSGGGHSGGGHGGGHGHH